MTEQQARVVVEAARLYIELSKELRDEAESNIELFTRVMAAYNALSAALTDTAEG